MIPINRINSSINILASKKNITITKKLTIIVNKIKSLFILIININVISSVDSNCTPIRLKRNTENPAQLKNIKYNKIDKTDKAKTFKYKNTKSAK